tara:strand:+ start:222 stop:1223 length:1002 start_codon:yes stop_codon:yes gene_type:complete
MTVKVAINGFGRIGRNILRAIIESERKDLEVVAINDLGSTEVNAHLLQFDSVHGPWQKEINMTKDSIIIEGREIEVSAIRQPAALPWKNIDIAMECTGIFTDREKAASHLQNGSSRVLISAPAKNADKTIVYGVNHQTLTKNDIVVSNGSCTTNCLLPVVKVLNEKIGIRRGFMTTIHSYTGDQPVLDTVHDDLYRARAANLSMIPTTTGAAKAVGMVLPELAGKLDGFAIRVPTPNVSVIDFTFEALRETSNIEINQEIYKAASTSFKGILGYTDKKLVSSDFNHDARSSIFAADQTRVIDKNLVRVLSWYDNEWGFSNRMADTAMEMAKHI